MADKKQIISTLLLLLAVITAGCYPPAGPPQLANPATQYCLDHGGSTQPRGYTGEGPSGLCVFPDDSVCDEWAFFRGECGPASQPLDEPTPAAAAGATQPAIWTLMRS